MPLKEHLLKGLCLVLACLSLSSGERARYDNYRLYKVVADSEKELAVLKNLDGASDSLMFLDGIHMVGKDGHVVVAPHKVPDFLEIMGTNEVEYVLVEANFQSFLENDEVQLSRRSSSYGWDAYYTLHDTYRWMKSLASQYRGDVTLVKGGKTHQERSILGVKISMNNGQKTKPGVFLEAGIHAREWIAPATATYITNQLLTSNDSNIRNIALNYNWYIFPHVNPDGYVYTHTTDRVWRKTRKPYGVCFGADANRNWGFHWNEIGASNNTCTDTYAGPSAFSEIETKSLSQYLASLKGKIQLYISFHAYSQNLLYPYGHTAKLPKNVADLQHVFKVAVSAMNKRYGTEYTGGNIYDAIYPSTGGSIDWVYTNVNTKMAFCYKLRPSRMSHGTGFKLPASQIKETGEETLDSIVAMVGEVKKMGYFN